MKNQLLSLSAFLKGVLFSVLITLGGCKKENHLTNTKLFINKPKISIDISHKESKALYIPKISFDLGNDWYYTIKITDDGSAPVTCLRITCKKIGEVDLCSEQDIPFSRGVRTGFIYRSGLNFSDRHPSCGDGTYEIKILATNKVGKVELKKLLSVGL